MSIAYLLGRYPTVSNTFVYREIAALLKAKVPVAIYALSRTKEPNGDILSDRTVQWTPTAHRILLPDPIPEALANEWVRHGGRPKDLRRARWLARKWRQSGVRCVHTHFLGFSSALAAVACTLAGIPLVVTIHARGILVPDSLAPFTLKYASALISISGATFHAVQQRVGRMSTIIPLPVEKADKAPANRRPFHILTVGRGVPKKGYPTMEEAVKRLSFPVQWTVAGADLGLVSHANTELRVVGAVSFREIERIYDQGVDVFALACCKAADGDTDGVPVAILEAMARGVAVVSTTVGGIPELITSGETGVLVPPDDPDAMKDALTRLEQDPAFCAQVGENGRTHVRNTRSVDAHVQSLLKLFGRMQTQYWPA